jgi:hypothetical protein
MYFIHNKSNSKKYTNNTRFSKFITKDKTIPTGLFSNSRVKTRKKSIQQIITNKKTTRKGSFKMFIPSSKNRQCGGCGRY